MFSNRPVSVRAPIVPMGILKSRPTGSHQSKWDEILSCLLSIHIHRVADTTYSMSEENILCEENLCIGHEYNDLFQFFASMLQPWKSARLEKKQVMPLSTLYAICWHLIITRLAVPTPDTEFFFAKDIFLARRICYVCYVG